MHGTMIITTVIINSTSTFIIYKGINPSPQIRKKKKRKCNLITIEIKRDNAGPKRLNARVFDCKF